MSTLYRKYRPQNFVEVVGQNYIKLTLEQEIKSGKLAHAYLFCGPRAVGKTTLARVFAKAINCEPRKKEASDPCNNCRSCEEITAGRALDIIEIDAASHTGVDNVRDNIIAQARVAPVRLSYKVFIIDEVHMLSISAFNALLKVIEEPPASVIFILCTTEVHKVPATIISRCQRFDFKRISVSDMVKKLNYIVKAEEIKIEKNILEAIARYSEGHMRDAESLLGQIIAIAGQVVTQTEADLVIPRSDLNEVINLTNFLVKKDAGGAIRLINKLVDDGVDLKVFLKELIEILRKIMLTKINPALVDKLAIELGESMELKINQTSQDLTLNQAIAYLERFIKVRNELKGEFIEQLPIELAIAELCTSPVQPIRPNPVSFSNPFSPAAKFTSPARKFPANTATAPATADLNITYEQILEKWNEVLARVKQYNHSLSFILRVCQPKNLAGNRLCLAFKYKFHKDRVSETNIKSLVERILSQIYSQPLIIEAVIDENLEVAASKLVSDEPAEPVKGQAEESGDKPDMINDLLKTFGGKIVK